MPTMETTTVRDWQMAGYRGLRIPRCPRCGQGTYLTWEDLRAAPSEDVIEAARRVRCRDCGQAPEGLAVVASTLS